MNEISGRRWPEPSENIAALRPSAAVSKCSHLTKRCRTERDPATELRSCFQRDRDRIIHSRAFRRLQQKTQVVPGTMSDHVRTRLTHTLEVSQISRAICSALGLNQCLAEAIALGHDIGHAPFGHGGESVLHSIMSGREMLGVRLKPLCDATSESVAGGEDRPLFGGFKHNWHSVRLVCGELRYAGSPGLNLTSAVLDGILKHTNIHSSVAPSEVFDDELEEVFAELSIDTKTVARTLEAQAVGLADEIAQATHDLEDGHRTGALNIEEVLGESEAGEKSGLVDHSDYRDLDWGTSYGRTLKLSCAIRFLNNYFITDASQASEERITEHEASHKESPQEELPLDRELVSLSAPAQGVLDRLLAEIRRRFLNHGYVNRLDGKGQYLISMLFAAYWDNPRQLPDFVLRQYVGQVERDYLRDLAPQEVEQAVSAYRQDARFLRAICSHIASMSDRYVLEEFSDLFGANPLGRPHPEAFR